MSEVIYGLSGANVWEQVYSQQHLGNPNNKKIKASLVEPFEIPILFERHVLAISAFYGGAPPLVAHRRIFNPDDREYQFRKK